MVLDHNQKRVLNVFRLLSNASKADVVRRIDLTHPAVTQIVRKLCDKGYLEKKEKKEERASRSASHNLQYFRAKCFRWNSRRASAA